MSKVSLTNLVNLQNETTAVNAINANNNALTTALNNTLSRDGTSPNQMGATLDMNSNRIVNVPTAVSTTEPVNLAQMTAALAAAGIINTGLTGVPVSAAMQPVVAAASIPAAQTAFGIPVAMQPFIGSTTLTAANALLGNFPQLIPQQFDALAGTSGHDSTAAINSAIAACPAGGTVRLPATTSGYTISSGFTITKAISIIGDGIGTNFVGAIGSGNDLFHVVPGTGTGIRGVRFSNFAISLTSCNTFFNFDTTPASTYMAEVEVSKIFTLGTNPTLHCIRVNDSQGSFFHADFCMNSFSVNNVNGAGVFLNNSGDSIRIWNNILTGTGYGVFGSQYATGGAGNLLITGCNITATGGVNLSSCYKPIIRDCEMEFNGAILTAACVVLNNCSEGHIGANQIQVITGATGFSECIAIVGTSSNTSISATTLSSTVSGTGILIGASATGTRLGMDISYLGTLASSPVSNLGTGTRTASYT